MEGPAQAATPLAFKDFLFWILFSFWILSFFWFLLENCEESSVGFRVEVCPSQYPFSTVALVTWGQGRASREDKQHILPASSCHWEEFTGGYLHRVAAKQWCSSINPEQVQNDLVTRTRTNSPTLLAQSPSEQTSGAFCLRSDLFSFEDLKYFLPILYLLLN